MTSLSSKPLKLTLTNSSERGKRTGVKSIKRDASTTWVIYLIKSKITPASPFSLGKFAAGAYEHSGVELCGMTRAKKKYNKAVNFHEDFCSNGRSTLILSVINKETDEYPIYHSAPRQSVAQGRKARKGHPWTIILKGQISRPR